MPEERVAVRGRNPSGLYVGVDGCRGRCWVAVALWGEGAWDVSVHRDVFSLWHKYKSARLILVDIPIGLRDGGSDGRLCDLEARRLLGRRGSTVFPAPCRAAVYARSYEEASRINEEMTARRLSRQTWGIVHKIREVEALLEADGDTRFRVRESHPEICFWALAGRPMKHSKKTEEGFRERLEVLDKIRPGSIEIVRKSMGKRKRVGFRDDLVDALALAVAASFAACSLATLPAVPEVDSKGLRMEMVYPQGLTAGC
jgi:predicted RNase H-like nuclease